MDQAEFESRLRRAQSKAQTDAEPAQRQAQLPASPPTPAGGGDIARGLLQGATMGFGDELRAGASAGLSALTGQGNFAEQYQRVRDFERQKSKQFQEQHPALSLGTEVAGGLGTGLLGGVKAAGTALGKRMLSAPLAARLGAASGIGAGSGAVAGLGGAEGAPGQQLGSAALGAAGGAVLGPVAEGLTAGVSQAARLGGAGLRGIQNYRKAAQDPITAAKVRLAKTLAEDTNRSAALKSVRADPENILGEASPSSVSELELLSQLPGRTAGSAEAQLLPRSTGQIDRLTGSMGGAGVPTKGQAKEGVMDYLEKQASPQYEKAYALDIDADTPELRDLFETVKEFFPGDWDKALKLGLLRARNRGESVTRESFESGDGLPNLRGWQAIKEHLYDVETGQLGKNGARTKAANETAATRRNIVGQLDKQNDEYRIAREMWGGASAFEESIDAGKKFMSEPADETIEAIAKLTPSERAGWRIGVLNDVRATLEKSTDTHDLTRRFANRAMRRKMEALLGPEDFPAFESMLDTLRKQQQTFAATRPRGGSRTARTQARDADMKTTAQDMFSDILLSDEGTKRSLVKRGAQFVQGKVQSQSMRDELGQMLLQSDPVEVARILRSLPRAPAPVLGQNAPQLPSALGLMPALGALPALLSTP